MSTHDHGGWPIDGRLLPGPLYVPLEARIQTISPPRFQFYRILLTTYLDIDFLTPENFSFLVFKEFKMSHGLLCRTVPASVWPWIANMPAFGGKKFKIEIDSSIWREDIPNRNRLLASLDSTPRQ